jgi:hypothetical protein
MAEQNHDGTAYKVYFGTTAPTDAFLLTDANYTVVGFLKNTSYDRARNALDKSNKDDGDESSFLGGRRTRTFSFSAIYDHAEDAGQAKVVDAYESATGVGYVLISTGVTGDTAFHGNGVVTSAKVSANDQAVSTIDFTVKMNGAVTETVLT